MMIYVVHAPGSTNKRNTSFIMGRVLKFSQCLYWNDLVFNEITLSPYGDRIGPQSRGKCFATLNAVLMKLLSLGGLQLN